MMTACSRYVPACLLLALPVFVVFLAAGATAAVCTDSPSAVNRMSNNASIGARTTVQNGDFSVLAWFRPSDLSAPQSAFYEVAGAFQMHVLGGQQRGVRVRMFNGGAAELEASALALLQTNEWALLGMSFNSSDGTLIVGVISESQPLSIATANARDFFVGPSVGNASVGSFDGSPALRGIYGLTAMRSHTISAQDILDVWNSQRHYAPYDLNNLGTGGSMNGTAGCTYMFNHAMTTNPINHAAGTPHQIAAVVGEPSTRWNFHIFDKFGAGSGSLRVVRLLSEATGFTNCSVYDAPGGFFNRPLPVFSNPLPQPHYVAGEAPKTRQLATQPKGLLRVLTSANSRGVQASDGSATGSANYAHGFITLNLDRTAGILNSPARLSNNMPWFGFDTAEHAPFVSGNVTEISATNFSRFWTGSQHGNSLGPGAGVRLAAGSPGASYIMRCRPEGRIKADAPLVIEVYVLRFPGASNLTWRANRHSRQGEPGTNMGPVHTLSLDTQQWSHTLGAGDSVVSASRIVLAGDRRANIAAGHAVQAGPCISLVSSVSYSAAANETTVDFEQPFSTLPQAGSAIRVGPWGYETIQYEWPAINAGSDSVWRGLKLSVDEGGGGQGAVVFAFSAYRPNTSGYVFGTAGWSGNGYWRQIDRAFGAAIEPWMAALAPDVWLQMFAQQGSGPSTINAYANRIRSANPNVEIAWLGDCEHESGGVSSDWQHYILNNAEANDVVALTAVQDDRLGSYHATLDDGLRADANHLNARGNLRLAEIWTEMLLLAALDGSAPPVPGDLTGNGSVGVSDLLILLSSWGPCATCTPASCPADLNGDCNVGVADLLVLLSNWG